ncbi:SMP-30/gluconolactonase/LRE family protein [Microbacterium hominis]|uniref:SMP-30/gluconolactonase/LRE family protein n=1 Tax=Microbacterium hominis TaxID=162426 RepID=UPI001C27B15F|nr:SMP-30/gluconolactonase/LRE family protein [Microbacterium hominis]
MVRDVRPIIRAEARVGEGPVTDPRTGRLCWVDILAGDLLQSDLDGGTTERWEFDTYLGAIAPRASQSGFAVAVAEGFGFAVDGALAIEDPVLADPQLRMNDAKCDPLGRLWAGSNDLAFASGRGSLHRWDGGGASTVIRSGLTLPNGLGWTEDAGTMILIDSMAGTVMRAPFDVDRGEVGDFVPFATVDDGLPDGLAVDREDCVWVAIWGASAVHRYDLSGRLIERVDMPVSQPSSCSFAADGTLYVTSAREGLSAEQLAREPLAGSVFAIDTDTRGVPVAAFAA